MGSPKIFSFKRQGPDELHIPKPDSSLWQFAEKVISSDRHSESSEESFRIK
jgi:hypothetical protein